MTVLDRPAPSTSTSSVPRSVVVAAWSVPLMIVGGFAWLATLPIVVVLVSAFTRRRARTLRWPALLLAGTYAVPYAIWKTRADPAPSLSKDIDPTLAGLVVAASALVIVAVHLAGRRARRRTGGTP